MSSKRPEPGVRPPFGGNVKLPGDIQTPGGVKLPGGVQTPGGGVFQKPGVTAPPAPGVVTPQPGNVPPPGVSPVDPSDDLAAGVELAADRVTDATTSSQFISDTAAHVIFVRDIRTGATRLYAGVQGRAGDTDGPRLQALFNAPLGLSAAARQLFVADTANQAVRRVDMDVDQVSSVVTADNARSVAPAITQFGVRGVAANGQGLLLITDAVNHAVWLFNLNNGRLRILAGLPGQPGLSDGQGTEARFNSPGAANVSQRDPNVFIVEDTGNRVLRFVSRDGTVRTLGTRIN